MVFAWPLLRTIPAGTGFMGRQESLQNPALFHAVSVATGHKNGLLRIPVQAGDVHGGGQGAGGGGEVLKLTQFQAQFF